MDPQVVGLYRQTPLEDALPAQANGGPREALQPAVVVASPEAQAASALIIAQSGDKGKADLLRADQIKGSGALSRLTFTVSRSRSTLFTLPGPSGV